MRCAYVTFLIKNDSYIPGALIFAYSVRKQNTKHDLLCFVDSNISPEGIKSLEVLYDKIIYTDQIKVENKRKQTRQDVTLLFNRFNALLLEDPSVAGVKYDKILVADCDILAIRDYDTLFELETPAGVINESKQHTMQYENGAYVVPKRYYKSTEWIWHLIYKDMPHGSCIPKEITDRVLFNVENMGVNAGIYLLTPNVELYESIKEDLKDPNVQEQIKNYNWPEMQYFTAKMSGCWKNIDLKFASISGYPTLHHIKGIHYVGLKPWNFKNKSLNTFARYDDFKLWYAAFLKMLKEYPKLLENKKLKNVKTKIKLIRRNPKYVFDKFDIENVRHLV